MIAVGMKKFAKKTVHRTLACIAVAPLALAAGLILFAERERASSHGTATERRFGYAWQLAPGHADPTSNASGKIAPVASGSSVAPEGSSDDARPPESQEIGERRRLGPGNVAGGRGPGSALAPGSNVTKALDAGKRPGGPLLSGNSVLLDGSAPGTPGQTPRLEDLPPGTGLLGQYWDHDSELTHIPNLDISGANITRVDPTIDFGADAWNLPFVPLETWATCWRGSLKVLADGHYVFVLGSDDGALLEIDNKVACGQDRLQGYFESRGELDLARGLHLIKIRYFNNRGPGLCRLFWVTPQGGDPAIVPQDVLYPAGGPAEVGRPTIASVAPQNARRGEPIKIVGTNFSDIPTLNKVTFGPDAVPAVVTEASATALTVIVPDGVDEGPISVKVGDLAAEGVPYQVGGFFGLYARTWRDTSGKDVLTYQDPSTATPPDDEQLVGPLDVRSMPDFKLPFAATRFRTCYTGRFWVQDAGQHTFGLESDDGSRLLIDQQPVLDDGGLHGRKHVEGALFLSQGWHDVEVDFFQNLGDANVTLLHGAPEKPLIVCPRALLAPPIEMDQRVAPTITSVSPNPAKPTERLLIAGGGLVPPDGRLPLVMLGTVPLTVVAASPGSVAVDVPFGVDSGQLVVRAGPLATPPVQLTVSGYGLKGEYWQLPGPLSSLPSFDTPPTLTRTDDQVDFFEDSAFKVPWEPDHFAVRWSAKVYAPVDGSYEFATGSDDGSRLTVDNQALVDNDGLHGYVEVGASVQLTQGVHTLVMLYFENEGVARARLLWRPPGAAGRVVIPRSSLVPAD